MQNYFETRIIGEGIRSVVFKNCNGQSPEDDYSYNFCLVLCSR